MKTAPNVVYAFGPFRIDPERQTMLRDGRPVAITPKVLKVLLELATRSHELVTKDELLQAVWPGRVVEEANLSQCIFILRRLLGDTGDQRRYIVTVPRRGYRFAEEVLTLARGALATQAPPEDDTAASTLAATGMHSAAQPTATAASAPAGSIAVLPFTSDSDAWDQQYFSDGLTEGLITALSQFTGLKVISRHSAFQFRNRIESVAAIGRLLGVAHLLEGSVRRQSDAVRITATLVNTADDSIRWARQYDRPYTDLFALQDAIADSVAGALKARLLDTPGAAVQSDRPPSGNLAAWAAFRRGNAHAARGTEASARDAVAAYQQAIRADHGYAAAHARLCEAYIALWSAAGNATTGTIDDSLAMARATASTALGLDPDSACARQAHAHLLLAGMDWEGARAEAGTALRLAPNDPEAQFCLATTLATLGQNQRALDLARRALTGDPRRAAWHKWLAIYLTALGRLDDAHAALGSAIALQPGATDFHAQLALIEILRGNPDAALAAALSETPGLWRQIALALALQIGPDRAAADAALAALIAGHASDAAYQVAEVYALRGDPDQTFTWLERAWVDRDGGMGNLLFDPLLLRYRADPRFPAFCRQVGLPYATDAVAIDPLAGARRRRVRLADGAEMAATRG